MTVSARATLRDLRRQVEAVARGRFGQHFPLRVYLDTSDGDPDAFDACIQWTKKPSGKADWLLFPADAVITRPTQEEALRALLRALQGNTTNG